MSPLQSIWAIWLPLGIHGKLRDLLAIINYRQNFDMDFCFSGCINPVLEPKPGFTQLLTWMKDMESRAIYYSSSTSNQKYEIVHSNSEYRITHAWWACENMGYTIGDFKPDTLASIKATWAGNNKKFWTTINDFDKEGRNSRIHTVSDNYVQAR